MAVSEGVIGELQIGFTGTMSAVFLKNLDKTRRGQAGRVAAGRIPGGLVKRGRRRTIPEQAEVVRSMDAWRAEGRSVTFIVVQLNREGVPGPSRSVWRVSAVCGSRKRRNGVLHNEFYAGRIV